MYAKYKQPPMTIIKARVYDDMGHLSYTPYSESLSQVIDSQKGIIWDRFFMKHKGYMLSINLRLPNTPSITKGRKFSIKWDMSFLNPQEIISGALERDTS